MLRSRFLWKLYGMTVMVILLVSALMGSMFLGRIKGRIHDQAKLSLGETAALLSETASSLATNGALEFSETEEASWTRLGESTGRQIAFFSLDQKPLIDSEGPGSEAVDLPELQNAESEGLGFAERFSRLSGATMLYAARTVKVGGRSVALVRVGIPTRRIEDRLGAHRSNLVLGTVMVLLVAFGCCLVVSRKVAAPLIAMNSMANAIAGGDYGRRVQGLGRGEFGQLARSFNVMAAHLRDRVEMITRDRNKLLAVLGGMVEGVIAVDREQSILHMNGVAGRILSTVPATSFGRKIWEVTRIHEITEILSRTLDHEAEEKAVFRQLSGLSDRCVEMYASPLRDGEGRAVGAVVVLHDITELERLESVRRDFVANVSHELKTPITAIRGMAETMVEDPEMPEETRVLFTERIRDQTHRLSSLVADLLTLARLESEDGGINREPFDLRETVTTSAESIVPSESPINFTLDLPEDGVHLTGDEEAIRQVITNLLSNALKYTPAGGDVRLTLRREHGQAILEVEDTGVGIEPSHLDRIFERFYRVDKARSRELGGTGLGLSIVKHVCRAHGGDISVTSRPGLGSTFFVKIPIENGVG